MKTQLGLYQTVTFNDFVDQFQKMGGQDVFSYNGKRALFDYLENLADEIDEPIEFDVIGLCCEFSEYEDLKALLADYSGIEDMEDMEDLKDNTDVLEFEGGLIIRQF